MLNRTRQIILEVDYDDFDAIQKEIAHRQQRCRDEEGVVLPDGDGNLAGRIVAEIVRDLWDYRAIWEREHPSKGE